MLYLDSSALVKLVAVEPESEPLRRFLGERADDVFVSSRLARVEVPRAAARVSRALVASAIELVDQLDLISIDSIVTQAAVVGSNSLRTLDAIHLAAALSLGPDLDGFVAYDRRLLSAARRERLPTAHPGMRR